MHTLNKTNLKPELSSVFLGYPHGVKGYKLWSCEKGNQRCTISRDVTFVESVMPLNEKISGDSTKVDDCSLEVELSREANIRACTTPEMESN